MVKGNKIWAPVEAFIIKQGFTCVDESAPVVARKYRQDINGLLVVIEPVFSDRGRGRLRFVCIAVAVYEGGRPLSGFTWYPGQQLSEAMNEALQRQTERARGEFRLAEERLEAITRDNRLCQGLADWVQRLSYGPTAD